MAMTATLTTGLRWCSSSPSPAFTPSLPSQLHHRLPFAAAKISTAFKPLYLGIPAIFHHIMQPRHHHAITLASQQPSSLSDDENSAQQMVSRVDERAVDGRDLSESLEDAVLQSSTSTGGIRVLAGAVVALGKFDALHVGHRALAEQAARMGRPFLVSFRGMAEILGWEPKLPIVAKCDRQRVMMVWAAACGGVVPQEYCLEFGKVRSLSPEQFVEKLAHEFHVKGVVAGANYRFGYKAAGDASDLVRLCADYGLEVFVVDPVMDVTGESSTHIEDASPNDKRERGQVSSTRVRKALAAGQMRRVADLLGRNHRLLITTTIVKNKKQSISMPLSNVLNQPPKRGTYLCSLTVEEHHPNHLPPAQISELGTKEVVITSTDIEIPSENGRFNVFTPSSLLGVEFRS